MEILSVIFLIIFMIASVITAKNTMEIMFSETNKKVNNEYLKELEHKLEQLKNETDTIIKNNTEKNNNEYSQDDYIDIRKLEYKLDYIKNEISIIIKNNNERLEKNYIDIKELEDKLDQIKNKNKLNNV